MVEITYLAIAGIALAAMFFGYGFGLFEGRSQGYKKGKAEAEQERKDQPPPQPRTVTVDDPGLLRIKNEDGLMTLDLDGTRVDPAALSSPQRKRLIEMVNLMRPWLERRSAAPASSTETSLPLQAQPESAPVIATSPTLKPTPQSPAPQASAAAKDERPATPPNSIIAQIDAILQARLAETPLGNRRVFLAQSPEGGVIVYVGMNRYMGVDDVPDADVKAAIRAAISEWEDKYTPGLPGK
jgi:hypothetical protein